MTWIQTLRGHVFDFENVYSNYFFKDETAIVLSRIPRFAGHTKFFYSVGQHSVLVAENVIQELKLPALLHDATEVFIGDISRPLKQLIRRHSTVLEDLEQKIWKWLAELHAFDIRTIDELKHVDNIALATERRDIMEKAPRPWSQLPSPWSEKIQPWSMEYTEKRWLELYAQEMRNDLNPCTP